MGNRLKGPQPRKLQSKNILCKAERETITFSFQYFTENKRFNFEVLSNQSDRLSAINAFFKELTRLSNVTWQNLNDVPKKTGSESMPISQMSEAFIQEMLSKNITPDKNLYIVRFGGKKYRMFLRRGSKCSRVAHVLAVELRLGDIYDHG